MILSELINFTEVVVKLALFFSCNHNLQTNSSKGQNVPSEKITEERLAKEYNVSAKTIKRDAEFAEGLEKINTELRNNILEGKIK